MSTKNTDGKTRNSLNSRERLSLAMGIILSVAIFAYTFAPLDINTNSTEIPAQASVKTLQEAIHVSPGEDMPETSTQSFSNTSTITIPSNAGNASPYPSTITVAGVSPASLVKATVTITGFGHVLRDVYRNELLSIVDGQCMPHHLGSDRRAAGPRLVNLLFVSGIHRGNRLGQRLVDEWPFLL